MAGVKCLPSGSSAAQDTKWPCSPGAASPFGETQGPAQAWVLENCYCGECGSPKPGRCLCLQLSGEWQHHSLHMADSLWVTAIRGVLAPETTIRCWPPHCGYLFFDKFMLKYLVAKEGRMSPTFKWVRKKWEKSGERIKQRMGQNVKNY